MFGPYFVAVFSLLSMFAIIYFTWRREKERDGCFPLTLFLMHALVEVDHEIIFTVILLPSAESLKKRWCQLQEIVCA